MLLGSTSVKAVRRTLMKLSQVLLFVRMNNGNRNNHSNNYYLGSCKTGKFSLRPYQNDYGNLRLRQNDYGN